MKVNNIFRLMLILSITLISLILLGTTKVEAFIFSPKGEIESGEITENILNSLPSTYNVDVKESDFEQALELVYEQVKEDIEEHGIVVSTKKLDDASEEEHYFVIIFARNTIKKIEILVEGEGEPLTKEVSIVYNNSSNYNETNKKVIEELKNKIPKDENENNIIMQYPELFSNAKLYKEVLTEIVNDSSIKFGNSPWGGLGGGPDLFSTYIGPMTNLVFKDDIFYGTIDIYQGYRNKITIPNNIEDTETAYINYATPLIEEYIDQWNTQNGSNIILKKIEKREGDYYNVYCIQDNEEQATVYDYLIIKKADNTEDVEYVKNLKLPTHKYFIFNIEDLDKLDDQLILKIISNYYQANVSDKSLKFVATSRSGGSDGPFSNSMFNNNMCDLEIYKNDRLCDTRKVENAYIVCQITVPNDIEDIEEYSMPLIKKSLGLPNLTISKGAKIQETNIDIENGYTIKSNNTEVGNVIIVKEKVRNINEKDTNTGIKLDTDISVVPENTTLSAEEIKEEKTLKIVLETLKDVSTKFVAYDISLINDNVKIQPNGKVRISLPIPDDFDISKLVVYRIDENGKRIEYKVTVEGKYATIETDHFSTYVLAENNVKQTTNNDKPKLDETPKTGTDNIATIISSIFSVISLAGIAIIKKY